MVAVYSEERSLEPGIRRLYAHMVRHCPYPFRLTIADNASVDDTPVIAGRLGAELAEVWCVRLEQRFVLFRAWLFRSPPAGIEQTGQPSSQIPV